MVLFKRISLLLPFIVILGSCGGGGGGVGGVAGDSGGRPEDRACNTVYYQEIIGSYSGQITAKKFDSDERVVNLNQCDWEVKLSIKEKETPVDYGKYGCLMHATYEAELISQTNNSSSLRYECLEIKDVVSVSDPHSLDVGFWRTPVWPVDLSVLSSYEYHPFNPLNPVVSPLTGGEVGSSFDVRVNGDGTIGFGVNVLFQSTQLEGFLIKE